MSACESVYVDICLCVYICKYMNAEFVCFTNHYQLIVCYQQRRKWKCK